jgi:alkylhydroperoxidase family enzyme
VLAPTLSTDGGRNARNVYGSLVSHPGFAEKFSPYGRYILRESSLPPRDRELLILRTGWRNQALYEWEHHKTIGLAAGVSTEEIEAITRDSDSGNWSSFDAALLTAADELKDDAFISDKTWNTLSSHYTDEQMVDVIATVGNYTFVCMFLNSLGVQLEAQE